MAIQYLTFRNFARLSGGGAVKWMMCDALGGTWTEVTPSPNQIMLKRMSNTEAEFLLHKHLIPTNSLKLS